MRIAVVGTGYVGLVTGTCFAETGNQVICVDNNAQKVERLKQGIIPIFEPGLEVLFERNTDRKRLEFTTDLAYAVNASEIIFLALPTPPGEDGAADLKYILGVAEELSKIITSYKVIINKSTVPVGTSEKVSAVLAKHLNSSLYDVISNPEFLREGVAVEDFLKPDRVVVGTDSAKAKKMMNLLYEPFVRQGNPILFMDVRSAELTKYAANAYLAMRISFMNEIANLCELTGADVDNVRVGIGSDSRIGKRFLFPGVGYGGSCFPKDVQALIKTASDYNYAFNILNAVTDVNEHQKHVLSEKIIQYFDGNLNGKRLAMWGLAFKPNTDDIREAPALSIIQDLLEEGASISAFDPEAMDNTKRELGDSISYCQDMYAACEQADALIIVTEWAEFRSPDFARIKQHLKSPCIFDGRNVYDLELMQENGFYYNSIGRNIINPA